MKNTCTNCEHWDEQYDDNGDRMRLGECRRYPPIPFRASNTAEVKQVFASRTFPITAADDYCGEFKGT